MERLGPSLEDLFDSCCKRLSLKSVLMLADQMVSLLEFMHSRSYMHCDIKPANFLMGAGSKMHICHIIDFGSARPFRNPLTGRHNVYYIGKKFNGTARYASINTHSGIEQSRRDDMESLGFVLIYFLRGSLPWQGFEADTKKEIYRLIRDCKQASHPELLCRGYPTEFLNYFIHCSSLKFEDQPDYCYLKRILKELFERQGYKNDGMYDWDLMTKPEDEVGLGAGAAEAALGGGRDAMISGVQNDQVGGSNSGAAEGNVSTEVTAAASEGEPMRPPSRVLEYTVTRVEGDSAQY